MHHRHSNQLRVLKIFCFRITKRFKYSHRTVSAVYSHCVKLLPKLILTYKIFLWGQAPDSPWRNHISHIDCASIQCPLSKKYFATLVCIEQKFLRIYSSIFNRCTKSQICMIMSSDICACT